MKIEKKKKLKELKDACIGLKLAILVMKSNDLEDFRTTKIFLKERSLQTSLVLQQVYRHSLKFEFLSRVQKCDGCVGFPIAFMNNVSTFYKECYLYYRPNKP